MNARYRKGGLSLLIAAFTLGTLLCPSSTPAGAVAPPPREGSPWENPRLRPDLAITAVQPVVMQISNGPRGNGGIIIRDRLWVRITNLGDGPVSNYGMWFQWAQGYGDEQFFFWFLGTLAPGASQWVMVEADGYDLTAADAQYRLTVDFTDGINESNEDNNVYDGP